MTPAPRPWSACPTCKGNGIDRITGFSYAPENCRPCPTCAAFHAAVDEVRREGVEAGIVKAWTDELPCGHPIVFSDNLKHGKTSDCIVCAAERRGASEMQERCAARLRMMKDERTGFAEEARALAARLAKAEGMVAALREVLSGSRVEHHTDCKSSDEVESCDCWTLYEVSMKDATYSIAAAHDARVESAAFRRAADMVASVSGGKALPVVIVALHDWANKIESAATAGGEENRT